MQYATMQITIIFSSTLRKSAHDKTFYDFVVALISLVITSTRRIIDEIEIVSVLQHSILRSWLFRAV